MKPRNLPLWRTGRALLLAFTVLVVAGQSAALEPGFVHFESGPVRPLSLSPSGKRLFVANVSDGRLEVLDVTEQGLVHSSSISVGLEPVAVAARSENEVWVINHLSDSVSIVDVETGGVVRTLLVGDEPRDIVFAAGRAFITTAHRGQRLSDPALSEVPGAGDPELTTPGLGRADVWVFDVSRALKDEDALPEQILIFFGDTPRALAVAPDESRVYVAIFHSGNQTTTLNEGAICDGFEAAGTCEVGGITVPGGNPGPSTNRGGASAPEVGLIVKQDGASWVDEKGRDFADAVRFELPDYDVFCIDPKSLKAIGKPAAHVGTTLFGMAINPVSGAVYVSNTDAQNLVRFEGPGEFGGSTVRGDLARAQLTVLDQLGVHVHPLNSHLDYGIWPTPPELARHSLATPTSVEVSTDGRTLYVAAFGSSRIGVIKTAALETGSFDPKLASSAYLETTGGGPSGLSLDEARGRLYVYTRFDNAVAAIDLEDGGELSKVALPSPEPASVREGRPFLYDARETSSNGEASCSSCHVFGDLDHLAWDLGDPDARVVSGSIPFRLPAAAGGAINGTGRVNDFHPMKGPMVTQTLRGLAFSGAQHWRGDRSVGPAGNDPMDAAVSFENFVVAFPGLLGRATELAAADMQAFAAFALGITMPPNPIRRLDNSLTEEQQVALDFFASKARIAAGVPLPNLGFSCEGCHSLVPEKGQFGTDGLLAFEDKNQVFKIPHLRNLYQKVGMFGMLGVEFFGGAELAPKQPQVRGFGFLHDGSVDTLERFLQAGVFDPVAPDVGIASDEERRSVASLLLAFDSDLAPIVGQQVTVSAAASASLRERLDLLLAAASRPFVSRRLGGAVTECDLVAKQADAGQTRGFVYRDGAFVPDDGSTALSVDALLASSQSPTTFTAVVPGSGERWGLDRDLDGAYDRLDACPSDPAISAAGAGCDGEVAVPEPENTPPTVDPSPQEPSSQASSPGGGCHVSRSPPSAPWCFGFALGLAALARRRQSSRCLEQERPSCQH